jgi:hypothetical protein
MNLDSLSTQITSSKSSSTLRFYLKLRIWVIKIDKQTEIDDVVYSGWLGNLLVVCLTFGHQKHESAKFCRNKSKEMNGDFSCFMLTKWYFPEKSTILIIYGIFSKHFVHEWGYRKLQISMNELVLLLKSFSFVSL